MYPYYLIEIANYETLVNKVLANYLSLFIRNKVAEHKSVHLFCPIYFSGRTNRNGDLANFMLIKASLLSEMSPFKSLVVIKVVTVFNLF